MAIELFTKLHLKQPDILGIFEISATEKFDTTESININEGIFNIEKTIHFCYGYELLQNFNYYQW